MVPWLGRRHCGQTQRELGEKAGGVSPSAVGQGVRRIEARRWADLELAGQGLLIGWSANCSQQDD
jgi:hypothetical protein